MCAVDAMHVQVHREWGAAGIRAVAPAHLPHPRVAGRRIMEPPLCTRPSVFSPGFFHRLATRRGAAGAPFVDRIRVGVRVSKPFRSVPTRGPFADHPREGGLLRQDKRCAPDVKLLNYPPSSNPTTGRNRRAFREISSNPPSYVLKFPPRVAWERERRRETSRLRVLP